RRLEHDRQYGQARRVRITPRIEVLPERARRRVVSELEIAAGRQVDATSYGDHAIGRRRRRKRVARRTAGDKAAVDEDHATIVQIERRHDVETDGAGVNAVVDQDLMLRIERARRQHWSETPLAPIIDTARQRDGQRGARGDD